MSQGPGIEATATPKDITAGLDPGRYVAQVKGGGKVYYATATRAPVRTDTTFNRTWFAAERGETFTFRVGAGIPPTWITTSRWADSPAVSDIAFARVSA